MYHGGPTNRYVLVKKNLIKLWLLGEEKTVEPYKTSVCQASRHADQKLQLGSAQALFPKEYGLLDYDELDI
jgi:hypothetical protein